MKNACSNSIILGPEGRTGRNRDGKITGLMAHRDIARPD